MVVFAQALVRCLHLLERRQAFLAPGARCGAVLGRLLGSVVGIWPFDARSHALDYALGGFVATVPLPRISA